MRQLRTRQRAAHARSCTISNVLARPASATAGRSSVGIQTSRELEVRHLDEALNGSRISDVEQLKVFISIEDDILRNAVVNDILSE